MRQIIGCQGEVHISKIDAIPDGLELTKVKPSPDGDYIVSHSKSGHHHVLTGGDVMERTSDVPAGMKILYAIVAKPEKFLHKAQNNHEGYDLLPGIYAFRISREYDPFAEQARIVAD